jgi:hypothetical protein
MADEKKSSIYDNGSSSELDEYGVWVTSEPTDVSSDKLADDNLTDLEAELGTLEAQPLDEAGDDLEMSFDMLDLPEEEELQEELNVEDILAEDDGSTDDAILLDESPEESIGLEETSVSDVKKILPVDASASAEEPEQPISLTEAVDHAPVEEKPAEYHGNTTEVFIENFLDDSPFDDDEEIPATQEEKEKLDEATPAETPLSREETVVIAETSDKTDSEDTDDLIGEVPFDVEAALAEAGIPFEAETPVEKAETPVAAAEEPIVEAETPVEVAEEPTVEAETPVEKAEEVPVEAVEEPTVEAETPVEKVEESQKMEIAPNLSTELLLRIAEELSSIRKELTSLKHDFLEHRRKKAESETIPTEELLDLSAEESKPIIEEPEPVHSGGFFDDSGDEKIALTGDELDNILLSADFTEEAGTEVTEDFGIVIEEESIETEVNAEAGEEPIIDPEKDSEELQKLREEGVMVTITRAPEDTSLLETEEISHDEEDVGIEKNLDLSDAVIDEPELQVIENPVQEPVLEGISFDDSSLDMGDEAIEEALEEPEVEIPPPSSEEPTLEIPESVEPAAYEEPAQPVVEEALEEPEAEIPPPSEEPTLEIPESVEPAAYEEPTQPVVEEATPSESIAEDKEPEEASPVEVAAEAAAKIPSSIKDELKTVLSYMDQLLESLPEEKIEEFASSKYFDTYKKLFAELGIV